MVEIVGSTVEFELNGETVVALIPKRSFIEKLAKLPKGVPLVCEVRQQQGLSTRIHFENCIKDVYANLPDGLATMYMSVDHFRDWIKIRCGHAAEQQRICKTEKEAQREIVFARSIAPYSIVEKKGLVVTVWTAKSTAPTAMGGKEFREFSEKAIAYACGLIGANPADYEKLYRKDKLNPALSPSREQDDGEASGAAPGGPEDAPAPPAPISKRRLTVEQAIKVLPHAKEFLEGVTGEIWPAGKLIRHIKEAKDLALTPTVPGYPLGVRDVSGTTTYFQANPENL